MLGVLLLGRLVLLHGVESRFEHLRIDAALVVHVLGQAQ